MKKKVFITGGGGMLASAIEAFYSQQNAEICAPTHQELDILNSSALAAAITEFRPNVVFHAAALHVNDCEDNPEKAMQINTNATRTIAQICGKIQIVLIYISSGGYFGDEVKYYSETDPVVLKTVYARTKYLGEVAAMSECKNTFAIRPGWLFGGSVTHKKNFFYQRFHEAQQSNCIKSADDKFGCPTLVDDLVKKIDEILSTHTQGLYHVTNSGGCSRFEYVKKIIESCGLKTKVEPVNSSNFPRKANVPDCELLNNLNLKNLGLVALPPWQDAIEQYTKKMLKEV